MKVAKINPNPPSLNEMLVAYLEKFYLQLFFGVDGFFH